MGASTFILASLTEAFKDRMEEDEVDSIAAEAAQKVRERTAVAVPELPPMPVAPPAKPQPVSMERALNDAEAQIAALDQSPLRRWGSASCEKVSQVLRRCLARRPAQSLPRTSPFDGIVAT